jgi:hypothetical protein
MLQTSDNDMNIKKFCSIRAEVKKWLHCKGGSYMMQLTMDSEPSHFIKEKRVTA